MKTVKEKKKGREKKVTKKRDSVLRPSLPRKKENIVVPSLRVIVIISLN